MDSKRILLAEDDENDATLTLEALKARNLAGDVHLARDGVEALDYLLRRGRYSCRKGEEPVLVLLDLKMPRVDGIEVLRKMRASAGLRDVPVVVFTSSSEDRDLLDAYGLGVHAYVVKPLEFGEFFDIVGEIASTWTGGAKPQGPEPAA